MEEWYVCLDCNVNTMDINEYYTVTDEVWLSAHPEDKGMLCIGCLEARLGRDLTCTDFPRYPINIGAFEQSVRLKDRIGRHDTRYSRATT